jgi:hypothetical protein
VSPPVSFLGAPLFTDILMKIFFWIVTILACIIAGSLFIFTITSSKGAPQEAAGAAMACAVAIIPYVFARAVEKLSNNDKER